MTDKVVNSIGCGGRLHEARLELRLTQAELATKTGVSLSTIKNYERPAAEPNAESLRRFMKVGINPTWLISGLGDMFIEPVDLEQIQLSENEQDILNSFRKLGSEGKKEALAMVEEAARNSSAQTN
jgi:transcriptional regulator with XRE-family HTH domain